jgi:hypothetical protein
MIKTAKELFPVWLMHLNRNDVFYGTANDGRPTIITTKEPMVQHTKYYFPTLESMVAKGNKKRIRAEATKAPAKTMSKKAVLKLLWQFAQYIEAEKYKEDYDMSRAANLRIWPAHPVPSVLWIMREIARMHYEITDPVAVLSYCTTDCYVQYALAIGRDCIAYQYHHWLDNLTRHDLMKNAIDRELVDLVSTDEIFV